MKVKAVELELESYKKSLNLVKENLKMRDDFNLEEENIPPKSNLNSLSIFLENNDCTLTYKNPVEIDACYKVTRALLISNTNKLDEQQNHNWVRTGIIKQLNSNIDSIINSFTD